MKSLPLLLLGLGALGACASAPPADLSPTASSAADRHRIEVEQTAERLEIAVAADANALSAKSRGELGAFASGYLRYGHGALVMSTPAGGANADAATQLSAETRKSLLEAGVSYAAVASSTYDAAGQAAAPIIVSFARFEARAPECAPLWEQDLAHQGDNQPWESFGCATQANLAAMVEDPRDLVQARAEDPRDSGRRSTVFEHYRAGEPTAATRGAEETVAISNAVN
jgi:pilus assembly protein CpaD